MFVSQRRIDASDHEEHAFVAERPYGRSDANTDGSPRGGNPTAVDGGLRHRAKGGRGVRAALADATRQAQLVWGTTAVGQGSFQGR